MTAKEIKLPDNWNINGLTRHAGGGYLLSKQVYCVQSGCCSHKYIENTARLITTCFKISGEDEKQIGMIDTGGLTWDFMVSVHKGCNVEDVVAVCMMVHGRCDPDDGRQLMYVFDVCTDPRMARRGIGKVLMDSVYRLCEVMIADSRFMCDRLWLVLDVDLNSTVVLSPVKLISFYMKCGFSESIEVKTIKPAEVSHPRWSWRIARDPATRRQLWREVASPEVEQQQDGGSSNSNNNSGSSSSSSCLFPSLSEEVVSELNNNNNRDNISYSSAMIRIVDCIERLVVRQPSIISCTMETPQLCLLLNDDSSSFCAVLPIRLK